MKSKHYGKTHIPQWTTYNHGCANQYKVCAGCGIIVQSRVRLENLRNGALFVTKDGIRAVKSEYYYPDNNPECVSLDTGEYAHFPKGGKELVTEIEI